MADQVRRQAQGAASEMGRLIESVRTMLVAVAVSPAVLGTREQCTAYLSEVVRRLPQTYSIGVVGPDGALICRNHLVEGQPNFSDREYFKEALASHETHVGLYTVDRVTGRQVLPIAQPNHAQNGSIRNMAIAYLDLEYLSRIVEQWDLTPGSSLTVADRQGVILARNPLPSQFIGHKIPDQFLPWVTGSTPGTAEVLSQDGATRILAYVPAGAPPIRGLYVSSGVLKEAAFAAVNRSRIQSLAVVAVGLLASVTSAIAAGRYFVRRPVSHLIGIADAWREGRRETNSARPSGREFAEIAEALDRMGTELKTRQERLHTIIGQAPYPLLLQAEGGEIIEASESWWTLSGHTPTRCAREWVRNAFGRELEGEVDPVLNPFSVPDGGRSTRAERELRNVDGEPLFWEFGVVALGTLPDGRALRLLAAADVTERRLAARRQEVLVAELNHRVKNTLSVVQAIGMQTAKGVHGGQEFSDKFTDRLAALARTHDLLTRSSWLPVNLRDILDAELSHFAEPGRLEMTGPDIRIPAEVAVSLCLITHEMTTNSVKYGALSHEGGRLSIWWREGAGPSLELEWVESAAVPIVQPTSRGFGSRLIERTIASIGEGRSEFKENGLHFSIRVRLDSANAAAA